ncbi:MAG: hypothetical protein M3273_00505 [Actinomycetota bacterium]|nr:hypothetical protein [Actinomycetota bacterium]
MRMRCRTAALLLGLLVLPAVASSPPAAAHDHIMPSLFLEHDGQSQRGTNYHVWWTAGDGAGACVGWSAVGPRTFPQEAVREPDPWGAIRIEKRQRPVDVTLKAWPLVDLKGEPVGDETVVETDIRRVRGAPTRQWGVVFEPPFPGDNYLDLRVEWKEAEGCGGRQGGHWTFHLFAASI